MDDDIIDVEEIPSGFLENVYGKGITNLKKQWWWKGELCTNCVPMVNCNNELVQ